MLSKIFHNTLKNRTSFSLKKACFGNSIRNKEIEFYTNLDDWWGENSPQAQLHKFNKVRVNYIYKNLLLNGRRDLSQLRVLDVGCGAGILSEGLAGIGIGSVTGIDPTAKCIELAQAHLETQSEDMQRRVQYKNVSVEDLLDNNEHLDNQFDLVCCSEVIEHVENQKEFLQNCSKLVVPNAGFLFLSSIAKTPEGYFLNIVMGEQILGLLPKGTHEWDYLINQETCEEYLDEVGFKTFARSGVTITNPLTKEMGEIPCLRANYMMMAKNI